MIAKSSTWTVTCRRFVAFMDIMGFRDRVMRSSHRSVLSEMDSFQNSVIKPVESDRVGRATNSGKSKEELRLFGDAWVKPVLFSDSIILISSDESEASAGHMFFSVSRLLRKSFDLGIPIKGAIANGTLTADPNKSLYFGKPLIDAYDLQNEVQLYGVILHHTTERYLARYKLIPEFERANDLCRYQCPLRSGSVSHLMVNWLDVLLRDTNTEDLLSSLYQNVSGYSRIYVDNTITFARWTKNREKTEPRPTSRNKLR
jgi:hypothetical protein